MPSLSDMQAVTASAIASSTEAVSQGMANNQGIELGLKATKPQAPGMVTPVAASSWSFGTVVAIAAGIAALIFLWYIIFKR